MMYGVYHGSTYTGTRWTDCTATTTGTCPTNWFVEYPFVYGPTVVVPRLVLPPPPKWWRWYDVFRTWAKPKLLRLLDGSHQPMRRVQERHPVAQHRRQKRRMYVQRLRAAH